MARSEIRVEVQLPYWAGCLAAVLSFAGWSRGARFVIHRFAKIRADGEAV